MHLYHVYIERKLHVVFRVRCKFITLWVTEFCCDLFCFHNNIIVVLRISSGNWKIPEHV